MRARQRGMSMVETLVGVALGLLAVAATAQLLATQVQENRALLADTRTTQELRQGADLVVRSLRRAGHWGDAGAGVRLGGAADARSNPYAALAPESAASDAAAFRFSRDAVENQAVDNEEQFGFRLADGVLQMQLGGAGWQSVTDPNAVRVTTFRLTPVRQSIDLGTTCAKPCPADSPTCPPRQAVRSLEIELAGRASGDATVTRSVRASVRLRNDAVSGACPA